MSNRETNTDFELLEQLKLGEETALTLLYDRYWSRLYASACKKLFDNGQAREIVQDVFLDLWKRRKTIDITNLPAYLEKAVRNRVINYVNRDKPPAFFDLMDVITRSPYTADHLVLTKDLTELLEAWIEALPEARRRIFVRHYFEAADVLEIASEMNLSPKTVQNQLSLSVQYLRTRFRHFLTISLLISGYSERF